jgi:hypothetical protein
VAELLEALGLVVVLLEDLIQSYLIVTHASIVPVLGGVVVGGSVVGG